jgi:hypothetical protein
MLFSIYDYKNKFMDSGMSTSDAIYVGTSAAEKMYGYMRQRPGQPVEGGQLGTPYFAEFRISELTGDSGNVVLEVLAAKPVMDGTTGWPSFEADGSPLQPPEIAWSPIGTLTIPRDEAEDSVSYRVAFSDSRNKWFRVKLTNCKASAFLLRG